MLVSVAPLNVIEPEIAAPSEYEFAISQIGLPTE
jgi:hypothetical protein